MCLKCDEYDETMMNNDYKWCIQDEVKMEIDYNEMNIKKVQQNVNIWYW